MSTTSIIIPEKLRIGFQKRKDALTDKLSYIIYLDKNNKWNQELSWQKWRDHNIDYIEVENVPKSGYCLNKGIQHLSFSHFSHMRERVRVHSQDCYEFEITNSNLLAILAVSNVSKKYIDQECVFAWQDRQLILLPTNSKEYINYLQTLQEKKDGTKPKPVKSKSIKNTIPKLSFKDIEIGDVLIKNNDDMELKCINKVYGFIHGTVRSIDIENIDLDNKTIKVPLKQFAVLYSQIHNHIELTYDVSEYTKKISKLNVKSVPQTYTKYKLGEHDNMKFLFKDHFQGKVISRYLFIALGSTIQLAVKDLINKFMIQKFSMVNIPLVLNKSLYTLSIKANELIPIKNNEPLKINLSYTLSNKNETILIQNDNCSVRTNYLMNGDIIDICNELYEYLIKQQLKPQSLEILQATNTDFEYFKVNLKNNWIK
jgi:hypothetical protein